jgi:hypothetical protein
MRCRDAYHITAFAFGAATRIEFRCLWSFLFVRNTFYFLLSRLLADFTQYFSLSFEFYHTVLHSRSYWINLSLITGNYSFMQISPAETQRLNFWFAPLSLKPRCCASYCSYVHGNSLVVPTGYCTLYTQQLTRLVLFLVVGDEGQKWQKIAWNFFHFSIVNNSVRFLKQK